MEYFKEKISFRRFAVEGVIESILSRDKRGRGLVGTFNNLAFGKDRKLSACRLWRRAAKERDKMKHTRPDVKDPRNKTALIS